METATELANLEKDNAERLGKLVSSGVQLQPGTFELIQITSYLETLIGHNGGQAALDNAKLKFAERASEVLDQLEVAARRAKFTA